MPAKFQDPISFLFPLALRQKLAHKRGESGSCNSVGRVSPLQGESHKFESCRDHHETTLSGGFLILGNPFKTDDPQFELTAQPNGFLKDYY